jgi:lipopolysaccharide export system protein LptA
VFARLSRIIGAFLITAACYTAYALAIAPWIEPASERLRTTVVDDVDLKRAAAAAERQKDELRHWFAQGDWELDAPKILETPQGKLLFDEYQPREDGLIEIHPCSMVFLSSEVAAGDDVDRKRRAIVLRAPQGALLRFDSFDLKNGVVGKLVGGELVGEVFIHSAQRSPGPEDDLEIVARDMLLNESDITTPHLMEFRLGGHHGRGHGVHILLDTAEGQSKAPQIRGIRSLTLQEQVFVHLEPSSGGGMFPGGEARADGNVAAQDPAAKKPQPPVEVRSSGSFSFDFLGNTAVFRKQVDVLRLHPDGTIDQMNGDRLTIDFVETPDPAATATTPTAGAKKSGFGMKKLQPSRIEMTGEPVVVRAANRMQARAQYLEHDVATRAVRLRDAVESIVRQDDREIRVPELYFVPGADGTFGTFLATGKGRLLGTSPDNPAQGFSAEWTDRMHFRPHENLQVLSAYGEARFDATGKGSLAGDEIHFWFREVPRAANAVAKQALGSSKTELTPDRMLALGRVRIDSPQMTGAVTRMEGWFDQAAGGLAHRANYQGDEIQLVANPPVGGLQFPPLTGPMNAPVRPIPFVAEQPRRLEGGPNELPAPPQFAPVQELPVPEFSRPAPTGGLPAPRPLPLGETAATPLPPQQQFHIDGEVLRLQIAVVQREMQVREVVVERNVRLVETKTKNPNDKPTTITGDVLHVVQPIPEQSHVTVTGNPAQVETSGTTITGGKLVLDRPNRTTNYMTVEGQGVLSLPVDRDLQGRPTAVPDVLHLSWQGSMRFDGVKAVFQRGVEGLMRTQYLRTDRLEVLFSKPPNLGPGGESGPGGGKTEIAHVDCYDGVFIESRTANADGTPATIDRIEARTLSLDQKTGDVAGEGPGEVTSIRLGSAGNPLTSGPSTTQQAAAPSGGEPSTINYLNVRFQRSFTGNQTRRDMTFNNQVRTLYGPVADWNAKIDPDRPEKWSQQTVMIDCDKMQVFSRPPQIPGGGDTYDLIAEGNTLAEGTTFTARAPRLTYAQAKDLLVIEGDNRTDAVLFQQQQNGVEGSGTTAKRFMIWPTTKRVQVDGVTTIDLRPN